jgi:hypothetical protein
MGRAIRIIGTILALCCIGYLVIQQIPNLPALDVSSPSLWAALAVSLAFYVLSQCAASEAWRRILSLSGVHLASGLVRGQPMVSQIWKYIPGNVAHLFGRIAIERRDGVAGGILAVSMVLEIGITLGVGLGVVGLLLVVMPDAIPNNWVDYPDLSMRLLPISIAALMAVGIGIGGIMVKSRLRALGAQRPSAAQLIWPLALHLASFSILGISLWAAALAVAPNTAPGLINCTLIFAFAWAAGFVMPGAPGALVCATASSLSASRSQLARDQRSPLHCCTGLCQSLAMYAPLALAATYGATTRNSIPKMDPILPQLWRIDPPLLTLIRC